MVFNIWNSFIRGREDAEAIRTEEKFSSLMDFIDSEGVDRHSKECIAQGFVALILKIGELAKSTLPAHLHSNFMIFLSPRQLRREAENFERQASSNSKHNDSARVLLGLTQELVSIYLLSQAWTARPLTKKNPKAALNSSSVRKVRIEKRISTFLAQFGKSIPRWSCEENP